LSLYEEGHNVLEENRQQSTQKERKKYYMEHVLAFRTHIINPNDNFNYMSNKQIEGKLITLNSVSIQWYKFVPSSTH